MSRSPLSVSQDWLEEVADHLMATLERWAADHRADVDWLVVHGVDRSAN